MAELRTKLINFILESLIKESSLFVHFKPADKTAIFCERTEQQNICISEN